MTEAFIAYTPEVALKRGMDTYAKMKVIARGQRIVVEHNFTRNGVTDGQEDAIYARCSVRANYSP